MTCCAPLRNGASGSPSERPRVKREVASHWAKAVLVCGKCSKKIGGGFGKDGEVSLARALRHELGLKKGRKARLGIVETRCLGVCPKHAVVVVDSVAPQRWRIVPAGTPVAELTASLDPVETAPPSDPPPA